MARMNTQVNPLCDAIERAGGASALAKAVSENTGRKVTHWNVHQWKKKRVPAHWCLAVSAVTGVSCSALRPDVFGAE